MNSGVFLILASLITAAAAEDAVAYDGIPPIEFFIGYVMAYTKDDCVKLTFQTDFPSNKKANIATFKANYIACRAYFVPRLTDLPMILYRDEGWVSYVKEHHKITLVILWILSKEFKGKNFGTAGAALDFSANDCDFGTAGGPFRPHSVYYCDIDDEDEVHSEVVALTKHRVLLFDFTKAFTIGMWVKTTKHIKCSCTLVATKPDFGPRFMFPPSASDDNQLALALGQSATTWAVTTVDSTDVAKWRHVGVAYKPPTGVTFFRNGLVWQTHKHMTSISERVTAQSLVMWERSPDQGAAFFSGQMACVGLFQEALSASEMHLMKNRCP